MDLLKLKLIDKIFNNNKYTSSPFKDNNKKNYRKENIQLLCYNCYFLFIGDVFTSRDIKHIEDHVSVVKTTEAVNFEVDDYHLKRLKELGLDTQEDDPDNVDQYISRI